MRGMPMAMTVAIIMDEAALTRLMTWLSPSYPVGAYSYSHGLEWAVEAGDIRSRDDLEAWLGAVVTLGSGRNDAILFTHTHRAATASDDKALAEVIELAAAFATGAERHLETTAQGRAFVEATMAAWPCDALEPLQRDPARLVAYPVAVAVAAAGHGIDEALAVPAYLHGFVANLVSAAIRLVPLGQTDGQRAIATLAPVVAQTARDARASGLDDLGSTTLRADLAAMKHETQETRLFRS